MCGASVPAFLHEHVELLRVPICVSIYYTTFSHSSAVKIALNFSRQHAANGLDILCWYLRWHRAARSKQEVFASRQFKCFGNFLLNLQWGAALEDGFLADATHDRFAGAHLALA